MGDPNLALYRAAIGQIMADAGITRSTIQEMVKQMIAEKVEKQFQYIAAHEVNTYSFRNKISSMLSDEIRKAIKDGFKNINISVAVINQHPEEKTSTMEPTITNATGVFQNNSKNDDIREIMKILGGLGVQHSEYIASVLVNNGIGVKG